MDKLTVSVLVRHSERLQRVVQRLKQRSRNYSVLRLAVVLGGLVAVYAASLVGNVFAGSVGLVVVIAFLALAVVHDTIEKSVRRHELLLHLTHVQIARIQRNWAALPLPHDESVDYKHPFAADLGITGIRSLQHLLDTTTSIGGSARLREWLLHPLESPAAVQSRQALVRELIPLSLFRKKLSLHGQLIARQRWDAAALSAWLQEETAHKSMMPIIVPLTVLAAVNIASFLLSTFAGVTAVWSVTLPAYLLLHATLYAVFFTRLHGFAAVASNLKYALERMQSVLLLIEKSPHTKRGALARDMALFHQTGSRPSEAVRSLARIARGAALQNNVVAWMLLNAIVPWNFFFYDRLNRYRSHLTELLPLWLDRVYELEALCALAEFAALHSDVTFPDVQEQGAVPLLVARDIGHPFLAEEYRINNDFTVEHRGAVALLSGSNMSGKSTFLRTLGINTVLALAGSAVAAKCLQLVPVRLWTSMAVSDSVVDGVSFFYAEVQRLKALLTEAQHEHDVPLLFLIDEIFRGTNNRERLIGGRSYIRALAATEAFGIVSTHDLELVQLANENPNIRNYHFREDVVNGIMRFDYKLHIGPCPTTNALKIMAMEGLPVDAMPDQ